MRSAIPTNLCGSPGVNKAMTDALLRLALPRFDIFTEACSAPGEMPAELEAQTVTIAGTGESFLWTPAAGPILDAALAVGLSLPSGCRGGQCESCSGRVVEGRFAHMLDVDGEPDQCLTCRAVPLSALTIAF